VEEACLHRRVQVKIERRKLKSDLSHGIFTPRIRLAVEKLTLRQRENASPLLVPPFFRALHDRSLPAKVLSVSTTAACPATKEPTNHNPFVDVMPASSMPDEMLLRFFNEAVLSDKMCNTLQLLRLSQVCKLWRSVVRENRVLFSTIQFDAGGLSLPYVGSIIYFAVKTSGPKPITMRIDMEDWMPGEKTWSRACLALRLGLENASHITLIANQVFSSLVIRKYANRSFPSTWDALFRSCPKARSIEILGGLDFRRPIEGTKPLNVLSRMSLNVYSRSLLSRIDLSDVSHVNIDFDVAVDRDKLLGIISRILGTRPRSPDSLFVFPDRFHLDEKGGFSRSIRHRSLFGDDEPGSRPKCALLEGSNPLYSWASLEALTVPLNSWNRIIRATSPILPNLQELAITIVNDKRPGRGNDFDQSLQALSCPELRSLTLTFVRPSDWCLTSGALHVLDLVTTKLVWGERRLALIRIQSSDAPRLIRRMAPLTCMADEIVWIPHNIDLFGKPDDA